MLKKHARLLVLWITTLRFLSPRKAWRFAKIALYLENAVVSDAESQQGIAKMQ